MCVVLSDILFVRVDLDGLIESGFMSPQFLCNFFPFFLIILYMSN